MGRNKVFRAYAWGIVAWAIVFILALKLGAVSDPGIEVIARLRLPRALLATAVGMGLAVAGAALQAIFSNPLCEPYTLGISSGSAFGAVIGITLGLQWSVAGLAGTAFLGGVGVALLLYLISLRSSTGNATLLLAGVMLGFLGSSLVALWMALADQNGLQNALSWMLGDLSRARVRGASYTLVGVAIFTTLIWSRWRDLDALLTGEEGALSLGIDVAKTRRILIVMLSLLIGLCVSASGMIGFVGLVIPHFARRLVGSLHSRLIPLCAIFGAITLTLADVLARVIARPYELPVGVVTALFGAPAFLWVMLSKKEAAS